MEFPSTRRVGLTFLLVLGLYAVLLPLWFVSAHGYASVVAAAATRAAFPLAGLRGSVQALPGTSQSLRYTLPDARTGGFGSYRQRVLNTADLPLAAAGAAGLAFLGWRRRLVAGAAVLALLFAVHVGLVLWSAQRLAAVLARPDLTRTQLDQLLPAAVQPAAAFGDLSLFLTLGLLVIVGLWLRPRRSPPAPAPSAGPDAS